jgi:hypothetical protein
MATHGMPSKKNWAVVRRLVGYDRLELPALPALECALDDRLDTIGGTALLKRYPSAPQLRQAGAKRLVTLLRATHRVHQPEAWVEQLLVAAKSQTVVVAGAETVAGLIAELAEQLLRVLTRRQSLEKEIERAFSACPRRASSGVCLGSVPASGRAS